MILLLSLSVSLTAAKESSLQTTDISFFSRHGLAYLLKLKLQPAETSHEPKPAPVLVQPTTSMLSEPSHEGGTMTGKGATLDGGKPGASHSVSVEEE